MSGKKWVGKWEFYLFIFFFFNPNNSTSIDFVFIKDKGSKLTDYLLKLCTFRMPDYQFLNCFVS